MKRKSVRLQSSALLFGVAALGATMAGCATAQTVTPEKSWAFTPPRDTFSADSGV